MLTEAIKSRRIWGWISLILMSMLALASDADANLNPSFSMRADSNGLDGFMLPLVRDTDYDPQEITRICYWRLDREPAESVYCWPWDGEGEFRHLLYLGFDPEARVGATLLGGGNQSAISSTHWHPVWVSEPSQDVALLSGLIALGLLCRTRLT